jgi:glycosyltransferase involved in cell wall biosynthesis
MNNIKFTVTVSMISFNDEKIIDECLSSIRSQDYNQKLINILMVDGGSSDSTLDIAKKYNVRVVSRPDLKDKPYIRGGIAFTTPETDLILFFSADNRLQEIDTLSRMVETFQDEDIVGCETLRYGYRKTDPAISRYFALIGGADPIAVGLGKADRGPHDFKNWHLSSEAVDCGNFYKVKFTGEIAKIPTLGANGFLFRRSLVNKTKLAINAAHTDICVDWIQQGYDHFSFIKNRHVIHLIDVTLFSFIKRRLHYEQMYSNKKINRIYSVFQKNKDIPALVYIICAYLTFIIPLLRAIKGYLSVRDPAWLLHPVMCFLFVISYSLHFIRNALSRLIFPKVV